MKKSKKILAYSAALAASVGLTGCSMDQVNDFFHVFQPDINIMEDVYGPPIEFEEWETQLPYDPEAAGTENGSGSEIEEFETTYFDPMENELPCVYGPPEMLFGDERADLLEEDIP